MPTETSSRIRLLRERSIEPSNPNTPQKTSSATPPSETALPDEATRSRAIDRPEEIAPSAGRSSTRSNGDYLTQMLAVLSTISMMLAARALLLLAGVGAFSLALLALQSPTMMALAVNLVYDLMVVIPIAALYFWRA